MGVRGTGNITLSVEWLQELMVPVLFAGLCSDMQLHEGMGKVTLIEKMWKKNPIAVHICCAPDAAFSLYLLNAGYDARGFFYNPCIHPREEYEKRAEEMEKLRKAFGIRWEEGRYDVTRWFDFVKGLEDEREGGKRCELCIYMRLRETAEFAKKTGARIFTTVLTNSPRKDVKKVFYIGKIVEKETGVTFLPVNFKKHGWHEKSVKITKQLGIYRQNYCGCVFSMRAEAPLKAGEK